VSVAVICLAAQVKINYHDQDFTLSGFDTFNATLEDQGIAFNGSGKPLTIQMDASGTTIKGATADGDAQRGPARAYFLKNSTVSGGANLTMSGAMAQKFALDHPGAKLSTAPTETTDTQIQSETLKYAGTPTDGRVDFPTAVTIDTKSNGSAVSGKVNKTFARTLHLTGSNGFITLAMNSAGNNALRSGEIAGPVTFSGQSETTIAGGTGPDITTFDGKADSLKFDFTKEPRTITMTGNVTMTSKGSAAAGDISADTVIVTVDANLKPLKVDITGSPAKTTLHQEPPR
jgi:hypothetical protein